MATDMLQYLDPDSLDETVLNIGQIKTNLEGQISALEEGLKEEMQDLPYARPDGIYPDMTVGAVIGADTTAQWAQRTTEGSGAATVRSVQGATVAWNQMRDVSGFVQDVSRVIAGHVYYFSAISAEDADVPSGGYIRWRLYTMSDGVLKTLAALQFTESGAHKVATLFTSGYNAVSDGTSGNTEGNLWTYRDVVGGASGALSDMMLIDLTAMFGAGNEPATVAEFERMYPEAYYPYSKPTLKPVQISGIRSTDAQGGELDSIEWTAQTLRAAGTIRDELTSDELITRVGVLNFGSLNWSYDSSYAVFTSGAIASMKWSEVNNLACVLYTPSTTHSATSPDMTMYTRSLAGGAVGLGIKNSAYTDAATFKTAMDGVMLYYELATPTTQPISPALPMTYKVQAGGSESIIVPDGEISAAPVLTVAEPVNAGDELARIWAAIQSLGYTRNTAQLSRPVSLTDIGSIDEVQKDTTDVVEIDTIKEVTE